MISAGMHTAQSWYHLSASLKSGQVPFHAAYGMSLWEHLAANPDQEMTFTKAMATSVWQLPAVLTLKCPFEGSLAVLPIQG